MYRILLFDNGNNMAIGCCRLCMYIRLQNAYTHTDELLFRDNKQLLTEMKVQKKTFIIDFS